MTPRILVCEICGSEKWENRTCENCLDLTDEGWAIKEAKDAYVADHINIAELEERLEQAYTNPPKKHYWTSIIYR